LAVAVGLLFPAVWFVMQSLGARGSPTASVFDGHTQPWQVMLFYDVWKRLTQNIEGHGDGWDLFFVFRQMDVYFSPWIYLFYVCAAVLILVGFLRVRQGFWPDFGKIFDGGDGRLLMFALLCAVPLLVLLTFARSKLPWYVAPAIPFMAMGTAVLAKRVGDEISSHPGWHKCLQVWKLLLAIVVVAAVIRQSLKLGVQQDERHQATLDQLASLVSQNHPFCYAAELRQSHRLALSFVGAEKHGWWHRPDLESEILGDPAPSLQGAQNGSGSSAEWRLGYKDLHQVAGCVLVWSSRVGAD
jgi:hypothetical protein